MQSNEKMNEDNKWAEFLDTGKKDVPKPQPIKKQFVSVKQRNAIFGGNENGRDK